MCGEREEGIQQDLDRFLHHTLTLHTLLLPDDPLIASVPSTPPRAEVQMFLLKFLMTAAGTFLNSLYWLSPFYLACSFLLVYLSLRWQPCYHSWVNHARTFNYGGLFYTALVLIFLVYKPQVGVRAGRQAGLGNTVSPSYPVFADWLSPIRATGRHLKRGCGRRLQQELHDCDDRRRHPRRAALRRCKRLAHAPR